MMSLDKTEKNMFSEMSNHELVDAYQSVADPMAVEMLKAEERRRNSDKALLQANRSNKIAIGSLVIAFASLVVAIIAIIKN